MNRTYRLVWNKALRVVQVVSELASSGGSAAASGAIAPPRSSRLWSALLAAGLCVVAIPVFAQDASAGGSGGGSVLPGSGGGAGNGMGGGAPQGTAEDYATAGGASAVLGVGGAGATGTASDEGMTTLGGTGGSVGGAGSAIVGGHGGDGSQGSGLAPSGGGGGGAGVYTAAATYTFTGTSITGGAGGAGGAQYLLDGAGGGGGGGAGLVSAVGSGFDLTMTAAQSITGGAGGAGGDGAVSGVSTGGGGGGGGDGILVMGDGAHITNAGSVTGGAGGAGGSGGVSGGSAGESGAGIRALGTGLTLTNTGVIRGGVATGSGAAGSAVVSQSAATIVNEGTLAGGATADGHHASAVVFNGTNNTLALVAGSTVQGAVEFGSGATGSVSTDAAVSLDGVKLDGNDASVTFGTTTNTSSINTGDISGVGHLRSSGSGTLTLGNVNLDGDLLFSHSGATFTAGTVHTTGEQFYTGQLILNEATSFNSGSNITFGGISSSNGLDVTAGGSISSTGPIVLAGTSRFDAGGSDITLTNTDNIFGGQVDASGRNISIVTDGALLLDTIHATGDASFHSNSSALVLGGDVDASGTLALSGASISQVAGSLATRSLAGSALGNITLDSVGNAIEAVGNLTGQSISLASSVPVSFTGSVNAQSLAILLPGTSVVTGALSAGTISLNGATGLAIGDGGTTGSIAGNVANAGTLSFNHADDITYAYDLSGSGALIKKGAGKLVLEGDSSQFSGLTTVTAGSLIVGGAANSSAILGGTSTGGVAGVTVGNGGALGGHGTIKTDVNVLSGGTLSPGNSIGTLTIDGNLTLAQGSVLNAELGSGGQGDRVVVDGDVALNGATLNVINAGGMGNGVYNLFSYSGNLSLTNGALLLGAAPQGRSLGLQILTGDRQVNLIDNASLTLTFWNANGMASAAQMGGGSGTWSTTSANWTNAEGSLLNSPMTPQPGFAVFGGASGSVTVDNTDGFVAATGMQFLSDGYALTGDSLVLTTNDGTTPVIRVGDGTAGGASTVAVLFNSLDGTQGLEKADAGTLVLAGTNFYSGETVISGGKLQVSSDLNLGLLANGVTLQGGALSITGTTYASTNRTLTLDTGGALEIDDAGNTFNWQGDITGSGALTVQGTGTVLLNHANDYTGGTMVPGHLQIGANGAIGTGALTLANGGDVSLAASGLELANAIAVQGDATLDTAGYDATFSGSVSGQGSTLHKAGAGTLVLTGDGAVDTTSIDGGTLQIGNGGTSGSLAGNVVNNSDLVFNRSDASAFTGVLTGAGTLTKLGEGTLQFTGDSASFTGTTTVGGGTLQVDGALGGTAVFGTGSTFAGTGRAGSVTLQSGATVSPGGADTIGTLSVTGDLSVAAGTQYTIDLDSTGHSDQLEVGGKATLQGGSVVSLGSAVGPWSHSSTYTILDAKGGVSGTFAGVTSNLAFLTPELAYTANAVNLTLVRNDVQFVDVGSTHNQRATAAAIESQGEDHPVFDTVVKLDAPSARAAYDQLSGEIHANLRGAIADDDRYKRDAINQHLLTQFADETEDHTATWTSAWGHSGHHDGDGNALKLDSNGSGLFVGADTGMTTQSRIGFALGAGHISANAKNGSTNGDSLTAALYGGGNFGNVVIQAGALYSRYDIDTHRTVDLEGLAGRQSGSLTAHSMQGFVEGAYDIHWDRAALSPFVNVAAQQLRTDALTERGTDAALKVSGEKSNLIYGSLGLRGRKSFGEDDRFGVFGSVAWQHASGDTDTTSKQRFVTGGDAFDVMGTPIAKNAGVGTFGLRYMPTATVTVEASWQGQFASAAKDQAGRLSVNWAF